MFQVTDVHLVVDPWTRESRGFGFVTMASVEDANRCIKYLNRSVLEGRVITVEKVMYNIFLGAFGFSGRGVYYVGTMEFFCQLHY